VIIAIAIIIRNIYKKYFFLNLELVLFVFIIPLYALRVILDRFKIKLSIGS